MSAKTESEPSEKNTAGIGLLNETSVHAFLKNHIDPDKSHQEVKIGRYFADVANENGIFEIQTRGFYKIRAKLEALLKEHSVTLVFPVTVRKTLYWIDPDTGDCSAGRKSPKQATVCEIWRELPPIADLLECPDFSVRLVLLETEEYRALDGFGVQKKYRASHIDRCPQKLLSELDVRTTQDLSLLFPEKLREQEEFTSLDFAKAGHIPRKAAQEALRMLNRYRLVTRVSHDACGYRYRLTERKT